jgi:hypothetical protein
VLGATCAPGWGRLNRTDRGAAHCAGRLDFLRETAVETDPEYRDEGRAPRAGPRALGTDPFDAAVEVARAEVQDVRARTRSPDAPAHVDRVIGYDLVLGFRTLTVSRLPLTTRMIWMRPSLRDR